MNTTFFWFLSSVLGVNAYRHRNANRDSDVTSLNIPTNTDFFLMLCWHLTIAKYPQHLCQLENVTIYKYMSLRRQITYCHRGRHNLTAGRGILTWLHHSSFTTNTIRWLLVVMTMVTLKCIQREQTLNFLTFIAKFLNIYSEFACESYFSRLASIFQFPFDTDCRIPTIRSLDCSVLLKLIQLFLASCFDNQ